MNCKKWLICAIAAFFVACNSDKGSSSQEELDLVMDDDEHHSGMKLLQAKGFSVKLEANLTANFTYNFSIDKHEVTCDEFSKMVKDVKCENGELPITNVTFFDAVLFANKKSKKEKLDTAYTYTEKILDSEGHCTNLVGYAFRAEVDAYRLPTEAEWTLSALQNWNPQSDWNAENSNFKLHKPCTAVDKTVQDVGLCDFAGNAMEWVNDWKGSLRDTIVANFTGAPDGGNIGERVLKGGSFRSSASAIAIENRTDVYTVTSSTRADYVGFRLAFGKIPNAVWMNSKGKIASKPISVLTNSSRLKKITDTYHNKIVFRNDETGNISYVNFVNGTPVVKEIEDSIDAYHPVISPDGNFVAFSTMFEGVSGTSELYVRRLDAEDSTKIKLDVKSAAIPRWRIVDADTEIVYVTSTENNSDEGTWKKSSTWSVSFSDGKFGTPRKIFDGAFNGGVSTDGNLAVSGAKLLRANVKGKNKVWYNGEQACNVSLSDSTKQTLFLDFGGKTGNEFAGEKYSTHEQILIADSSGNLVKMIPSPKGYSFDHVEWANRSGHLAVATLTTANGEHSKIALVNTKDSNIVELAGGAELWHPNLWIGTPQNFETTLNLDSAGMYELNSPFTGDMSPMYTRYDLELLYRYRDSINVLISGSSRPWAGIDPTFLNESGSGIFSINAANPAVDLGVAQKIILNYGYNLLPKLKVGVVSFDLDILFMRYFSSPSYWNSIFLLSPGFVYDESHDFWSDGYPEGLYELTRDSYGENEENRKFEQQRLGFRRVHIGGWEGNIVQADTTYMDAIENLDDFLLENIENMIKEAEEKNIYLIGILFPQSPSYKETGAFGRYGLRRSVAIKMIDKLYQFEKKYPHFRLMDENKMGDHDYDDEMAMNFDHLSYKGAEHMTKRLDSLIRTLK